MKKQTILFFLFVLIIGIQSCIPSLHPLYTEKDLIFVEDLLGTWGEEDSPNEGGNKLELTSGDGETWRFEKSGEKEYLLTQIDKEGAKGQFDVRILKLGDDHFMDFHPKQLGNDSTNSFWAYHLMPVHTFAKIELTKEYLTIRMFNAEFLEELIKHKQIRIKHEQVEDGYLLTAGSEELQKFVTKYADEEKAFIDATSLKRRF